ncbi:MAG: carboxypeptidase regulatory-like domain-containing protein [Candidatus Thermoplasmatota archaeon]|nr:carboxypeptidase regulatory-like domain-containing protein [Candidatus Thermoplasmatota archaeon]
MSGEPRVLGTNFAALLMAVLLFSGSYMGLKDGALAYDMDLSEVPPEDTVIKGYVENSSGPIEGAMVCIMDTALETLNVTYADVDGYYELGVRAGFRYLTCVREGYEGSFLGLEVSKTPVIWANVTLVLEEFILSGTVNGPDGEPMESATVQYLQRHVSPGSNSARTDELGHFSIDIAGGDGFLLVVDVGPNRTGTFDVYFRGYEDVSGDIELTIDLTEKDLTVRAASVSFDTWSDLTFVTGLLLPVNNSMAQRAMVDLLTGDGDLVVSSDEEEIWESILTDGSPELNAGLFGNLADNSMVLDGIPFRLVEGSLRSTFGNLTGPVEGKEPVEVVISASYGLIGEPAPDMKRELSFNLTYERKNEEMTMYLTVPEGFRHTGTSETGMGVISSVNRITLASVKDPYPGDGVENERVTLTFHEDTFQAIIVFAGTFYEGEEANLTLDLTDHLPDNSYRVSWSINRAGIRSGEATFLKWVFPDDGLYEVGVEVNDTYSRTTWYEMTVVVLNRAPGVTIEIIGGTNRTFHEGDSVELLVDASDVEDDPLTLEWAMNGLFGTPVNYSREVSMMSYVIPDDGAVSFQARVRDDDGGSDIASVALVALNVPPSFGHSIFENGLSGDLDVVQGENVTISVHDVTDASELDTPSIEWTIPEEGLDSHLFDQAHSLAAIFIEIGNYNITINVSDEDGGHTVRVLHFRVEENYSFDQDGDGTPKWWENGYDLSDTDPADALLDPDSDGSTNMEEYEMGTDPRNSDTDNDGVPDRWDGYPLDKDRYERDSDGDGHYDWDEVQAGTDPFDKGDHPGKNGGPINENLLLWTILTITGILLVAGSVMVMASRSARKGMEYEE